MSARLTRELIQAAHPHPVADDPSVMPTASEEEIVAERAKFLEASQQSQDGLWLFAYGSLIWNPELEFADSRPAIALGWHRRFCLWQWRYRGSKDRPGLMLALDRGGSCQGLAYRVNGPEIGEKIAGVWRREMIGLGYRPRWLHLNSSAGRLRALGFVVNQNSPRYAGHLPLSGIFAGDA